MRERNEEEGGLVGEVMDSLSRIYTQPQGRIGYGTVLGGFRENARKQIVIISKSIN